MSSDTADPVFDENGDEVFVAPWSIEDRKRRDHIEKLPGTRLKKSLDGLNQSSYIFNANTEFLTQHIVQFTQSDLIVDELSEEYSLELVRHLHNYLASVSTLIDQQRVVIRQCWSSKEEPRRLAFEAGYQEQLSLKFDTEEAVFIKRLRNYCMHYSIPTPSIQTTISGANGVMTERKNSLRLKRATLLQWGDWTASGRRYLEKQEEEFDLAPIIQRYIKSAMEFYRWFWDAMNEANKAEIEEVERKTREYYFWYQEVLASPAWIQEGLHEPPPGWSYKRMKAQHRIDRFNFGSFGYLPHLVDSTGNVEWHADTWSPLPLRDQIFKSRLL